MPVDSRRISGPEKSFQGWNTGWSLESRPRCESDGSERASGMEMSPEYPVVHQLFLGSDSPTWK